MIRPWSDGDEEPEDSLYPIERQQRKGHGKTVIGGESKPFIATLYGKV